MAGRLTAKVCLVTGTGTGGSMGRATALTFAREGAKVVGCDIAEQPAEETAKLVETAGGEMVSAHEVAPNAIAEVIAFLVSEAASPVSGAVIPTYGV
jgi:NAD(P)-dependent dehydrogenase (short-subunit alcohol dehydrogenase family)